jgi:hypothetical protein
MRDAWEGRQAQVATLRAELDWLNAELVRIDRALADVHRRLNRLCD